VPTIPTSTRRRRRIAVKDMRYVLQVMSRNLSRRRLSARAGSYPVHHLERAQVAIEGRPLLWVHPSVTREWLGSKSFAELANYLRSNIRDAVRHYIGRIGCWEVANEEDDWANVGYLTHEEIVALTRLSSNLTKEVDIRVEHIGQHNGPIRDLRRNRQTR
jgi:hypothetical protein